MVCSNFSLIFDDTFFVVIIVRWQIGPTTSNTQLNKSSTQTTAPQPKAANSQTTQSNDSPPSKTAYPAAPSNNVYLDNSTSPNNSTTNDTQGSSPQPNIARFTCSMHEHHVPH